MRKLMVVAAVVAAACSGKPQTGSNPDTAFSNMDSLVAAQVAHLKNSKYELHKLIEKDGKSEQVSFVPDSAGWAKELNIFRELDAVNKATFRSAYTVTDGRDTNSNLKVKEVKALAADVGSESQQIRRRYNVQVSSLKFFYLNDPKDLRRIEARWNEENAIYKNTRKLTMEFDHHLLHRYRIEGMQKMRMNDSIHFVIAGEIAN